MPTAVEQFDLRGYDLVISSDANVTKGVVTSSGTLHVNYCHTPMRYAWDLYHDYLHGSGLGRFKKAAMALFMNYLRSWDVAAANRVDYFIANSRNVQSRIAKHYRRESEVIYPPVDVEGFQPAGEPEDFYLVLGQLIPYKRVDLAVQAFNQSGRKLVVVGEGSEANRLRAMAGPNIRFLGHQPFDSIRSHYSRCRALIFSGEEDFGITPLEAQASGRPVIAFGRGGALETVREGETGLFFGELSPESLNQALDKLEAGSHGISSDACRQNALRFSEQRFRDEIAEFISRALAKQGVST
jgi:glycosyltransferase involved in cell wall biosynthesis